MEVVAPGEAQFECEVSAALPAPPRWSLNGETLRAGAHVAMESAGRVHRLTLRHTSAGMSGVVKVALGNARSKAQLTVRGTSQPGALCRSRGPPCQPVCPPGGSSHGLG